MIKAVSSTQQNVAADVEKAQPPFHSIRVGRRKGGEATAAPRHYRLWHPLEAERAVHDSQLGDTVVRTHTVVATPRNYSVSIYPPFLRPFLQSFVRNKTRKEFSDISIKRLPNTSPKECEKERERRPGGRGVLGLSCVTSMLPTHTRKLCTY